jgi:signal peptidase I
MKSFQDRINEVTRGGWIRAGVWSALYIAFVVWVAWGDWSSLGWLVLLPLIIDMFTTRYINYSWWRKYKMAPFDGITLGNAMKRCFLIKLDLGD